MHYDHNDVSYALYQLYSAGYLKSPTIESQICAIFLVKGVKNKNEKGKTNFSGKARMIHHAGFIYSRH